MSNNRFEQVQSGMTLDEVAKLLGKGAIFHVGYAASENKVGDDGKEQPPDTYRVGGHVQGVDPTSGIAISWKIKRGLPRPEIGLLNTHLSEADLRREPYRPDTFEVTTYSR